MDKVEQIHPAVADYLDDVRIGAVAAARTLDAPDAAPASLKHIAWHALLDELSFGIAIVDHARRVLYSNAAARASLGPAYGLTVRDGVLLAARGTSVARLNEALDGALEGRRRFVTFGHIDARACMAALPMMSQGASRLPMVALILERVGGIGGLGMYFFASEFGITAAEQRVLGELVEGAVVSEAARAVGCAENTARTHVRSLLQKTGLTSLRRLIAKVGALPPIATRFGFACGGDAAETGACDGASPARRHREAVAAGRHQG